MPVLQSTNTKQNLNEVLQYLHKIGLAFRLNGVFKMHNVKNFDIVIRNDKIILSLSKNISNSCKQDCIMVVKNYNKMLNTKPKEQELKLEMEEI